jgi:hypothetical protein
MNNFLVEKEYNSWELLIDDLSSNQTGSKIYRGHSNEFDKSYNKTIDWKLISSYNRVYPYGKYQFRTMINQQLNDELFKQVYSNYKYEKIENLYSSNLLERLYFFQHYGIPTCLIDFTKEPLVALYFAISNVKGNNAASIDKNDNPVLYPNECYASIIEIDYKALVDIIGINIIDIKDFPQNKLMSKYSKYEFRFGYAGLDLEPLNNCKETNDNYNLKKQKGCFLLFDNEGSGVDFLDIIKYSQRNNISSKNPKQPLARIYKLNYNAIFKKGNRLQNSNKRLFRFLESKESTGKFLFNDIQGLKYDFNFFHF